MCSNCECFRGRRSERRWKEKITLKKHAARCLASEIGLTLKTPKASNIQPHSRPISVMGVWQLALCNSLVLVHEVYPHLRAWAGEGEAQRICECAMKESE
jgi:hypothetical protein